jgi:hypothetical protein
MDTSIFEEVLRVVAEEVKESNLPMRKGRGFRSDGSSRWYLKSTADAAADAPEVKREDAASVHLQKFICGYLKEKPELEGVHFSDLFEQYLPVRDKPRRLLSDWLPEYFIKTSSGTWRLPEKEESVKLSLLREAGTLRRIKRFANTLIEGGTIREIDRPGNDVNLLVWLRECRRAGLYEQGKAIYEKGGLNSANLTDEQQIEAEDDYRICARRGGSEDATPRLKSRKSRKTQDDDE